MEKTAQTTPIGYEMETIDEETCNAMEYQKLTKHPNKEFWERWTISFANEICNLEQDVGRRIKVSGAIYFIKHKDIMADQKETYGRIEVDYFPQKEDPYWTRLTVSGNLINYPGDVGTIMDEMITSKFLFNSILSTPYGRVQLNMSTSLSLSGT